MCKFIDQSAKAGAYAHPSEFVRALIRRKMENNETLGLIASVHRGLADIEHGRYDTFDAEKTVPAQRKNWRKNRHNHGSPCDTSGT